MFLGIDQSLRSTGLAVVTEQQEVIHVGAITPKNLVGVPRLAFIRDEIERVIRREKIIHYAALEGYSMESVNRSFDLGELGGLVRLVLHDAGIPFLVVPPTTLKLFVSSNGASDKEAMCNAVFKKWKQKFDPEEENDECDAFGLAQVARAFHLNTGTTRAELEVIKKLRDTSKKISLVSSGPRGLSV